MAWTRKNYDKFKMPEIVAPARDNTPTMEMPVVAPPEIPARLIEKLSQTLAPPVPEPVNAGTGRVMPVIEPPVPDAQAVLAPQSLPQITPPAQTNPIVVAPAPPIIEAAPRPQSAVLGDRIAAVNDKDYSIQKDEFGNITHRGKDRDKKWSTMDKIGSAIIGWAQGGIPGAISAATDRNFMEKMGDDRQRSRIMPQIEQARKQEEFQTNQAYKDAQVKNFERDDARSAEQFGIREQNRFLLETKRFENRMKVLDKQREADGGKWDKHVDEEGKVWKRFKNDPDKPLEPVVNPNTGEQEIDPSNLFYETVSPITGQRVRVKGSQLFSGEATIAAGDANRQVSADKTNAGALADYDKQKSALDAAMAEANSRIKQTDIQINGIDAQIQQLNAQKSAATDEAAIKALDGQIKTLEGQKMGLNTALSSARADYDGAKAKYDGLKTPQSISAPQVGKALSGKRVSLSSARALAKSKGKNLSDDELRRQIESQGGVAY